MTKPPVVVVEVGQCKICRRSGVKECLDGAVAGRAFVDGKRSSRWSSAVDDDDKWNAAKNLQSLTGGWLPLF